MPEATRPVRPRSALRAVLAALAAAALALAAVPVAAQDAPPAGDDAAEGVGAAVTSLELALLSGDDPAVSGQAGEAALGILEAVATTEEAVSSTLALEGYRVGDTERSWSTHADEEDERSQRDRTYEFPQELAEHLAGQLELAGWDVYANSTDGALAHLGALSGQVRLRNHGIGAYLGERGFDADVDRYGATSRMEFTVDGLSVDLRSLLPDGLGDDLPLHVMVDLAGQFNLPFAEELAGEVDRLERVLEQSELIQRTHQDLQTVEDELADLLAEDPAVSAAKDELDEADERLAKAEDELAAAEDELAAAQDELAAAEQDRADAEAAVAAAEEKVAAAEDVVAAAEADLADAEQAVADLEADIAATEALIADLEAQLEEDPLNPDLLADLEEAEERLAQYEEDLESAQATRDAAAAALADAEADRTAAEDELAAAQADLDDAVDAAAAAQQAVDAAVAAVDKAEATVAKAEEELAAAQQELSDAEALFHEANERYKEVIRELSDVDEALARAIDDAEARLKHLVGVLDMAVDELFTLIKDYNDLEGLLDRVWEALDETPMFTVGELQLMLESRAEIGGGQTVHHCGVEDVQLLGQSLPASTCEDLEALQATIGQRISETLEHVTMLPGVPAVQVHTPRVRTSVDTDDEGWTTAEAELEGLHVEIPAFEVGEVTDPLLDQLDATLGYLREHGIYTRYGAHDLADTVVGGQSAGSGMQLMDAGGDADGKVRAFDDGDATIGDKLGEVEDDADSLPDGSDVAGQPTPGLAGSGGGLGTQARFGPRDDGGGDGDDDDDDDPRDDVAGDPDDELAQGPGDGGDGGGTPGDGDGGGPGDPDDGGTTGGPDDPSLTSTPGKGPALPHTGSGPAAGLALLAAAAALRGLSRLPRPRG